MILSIVLRQLRTVAIVVVSLQDPSLPLSFLRLHLRPELVHVVPVRALQHVAEDLYLVRGGDDAHLWNYIAVRRGKESRYSVAVDDNDKSSILNSPIFSSNSSSIGYSIRNG